MPANKTELLACLISKLCSPRKKYVRTHVYSLLCNKHSYTFHWIGMERLREFHRFPALLWTSRSLISCWSTLRRHLCSMNGFITTVITRCNCLNTCELQVLNGIFWIMLMLWIFCTRSRCGMWVLCSSNLRTVYRKLLKTGSSPMQRLYPIFQHEINKKYP